MLDRIQSMIEEYNIIVLFRHEYPDMDAIGAQLGLKQIIKEKYPEKNVYALGAMSTIAGKFIDRMDEIEDDKLSSALAVILDTSNSSRVDDQRYKVAAASIRIDHHIPVEQFCDVEYIDEKSTATCELIALGLHSLQCTVSKKAAQLLYEGLVADSIRFTISTVRKETMVAAAYLIDQGADVVQCEEDNFYSTFEDFQYETKVRQKAVRYENCLIEGTAGLRTHTGRRPGISLTTNALGLAHRAQALADAGLQRINVSLDTVNPARYHTRIPAWDCFCSNASPHCCLPCC